MEELVSLEMEHFQEIMNTALTTSSGFVIQPEIVIPEDAQEINVSSDGVVSVQLPGAVEQEEVGQVELAEFQTEMVCNQSEKAFL